MKLKLKTKLHSRDFDTNKRAKLTIALAKASFKKRKGQLKQEKLEVKLLNKEQGLNISGDKRGMHHAFNPPSSEQMRKTRAMRKLYNKAMPVLNCSTCAYATSCPQFKAGYECAFLPFLNSHSIQSREDLEEALNNLAEAGVRRAHLITMMETLSGERPSIETSEQLNLAFHQLAALKKLRDESDSTLVTATINGEGTIIGRIFGNLGNLMAHTKNAIDKPIDVQAVNMLPVSSDSPDLIAFSDAKSEVDLELLKEHAKDELEPHSTRTLRKAKEALPEISVGKVKKK